MQFRQSMIPSINQPHGMGVMQIQRYFYILIRGPFRDPGQETMAGSFPPGSGLSHLFQGPLPPPLALYYGPAVEPFHMFCSGSPSCHLGAPHSDGMCNLFDPSSSTNPVVLFKIVMVYMCQASGCPPPYRVQGGIELENCVYKAAAWSTARGAREPEHCMIVWKSNVKFTLVVCSIQHCEFSCSCNHF